jgi:hypothetical protein
MGVIMPRTQRPARDSLDTLLQYAAYIYVLRVPILACAILIALPWVALPRTAPLGSLLRGLFDLSDQEADNDAWRWVFGFVSFGLVTLAALMAAAAVTITARLIVRDGHARFRLQPIRHSDGVELVLRIIPLFGALSIIAGASFESRHDVSALAALIGIAAGFGTFVLAILWLNNRWWPQVFGAPSTNPVIRLGVAGTNGLIRLFQRSVVSWTPAGFVNPATRQPYERHIFALLQLVSTLFLYALLGLIKTFGSGPPRIPTLVVILVVVAFICWALAALSFVFDRFRIPVLALLVGYGTLVSVFPQGDHFFPSSRRATTDKAEGLALRQIRAADVLRTRAGQPVIVVAATGGGIQAAAWTARVLAGLLHDAHDHADDFEQAFVAISGVSGGSVGAMYVVDAYRGGRVPLAGTVEEESMVKAAEASSLDDVALGAAYRDLPFTIFPFLKGVSLWPPHLLDGPGLVLDRGTSLEDAWKRTGAPDEKEAGAGGGQTPSIRHATLDDWRRALRHRERPAVIFNATVAENGARMLFGTTAFDGPPAIGRLEFGARYPDLDVPVVTAVRLSATFPYVSPAARVRAQGVFDRDLHMVDGGYYDNYGTATLIEWLDEGLRTLGDAAPSRLLILQIRSSPTGVGNPEGKRGWLFEAAQPLETLAAVRGTGQLSHSNVDVGLTQELQGARLGVVTIEFPRQIAQQMESVDPPLSWHLTPAERGQLKAAWNCPQIQCERRLVHAFLTGARIPHEVDHDECASAQ